MKYTIRHVTTYKYSDKVSLTQNHARLIPLNTFNQKRISASVTIVPEPDYQAEFKDYFDNTVTVFEIPTLHEEMQVIATSEVEIQGAPLQGLFAHNTQWESVRDQIRYPVDQSMLAAQFFTIPTRLTQANKAILDFTFDPAFATINTPVSHVFEHKRGVCQDYAHLTLTCLRSIGLAARYVSGYIETIPPPGQEKLTGADATHAWVALFVPGSGWIDYDPTNNLKPYDQHVTLAVGRDFADITPLKGIMFGGGNQVLDVSVDMNRGQ